MIQRTAPNRPLVRQVRRLVDMLGDPAVRHALVLFLVVRLLISAWSVAVLAVRPLPSEPDEVLRPYLAEPILSDGPAGLILGPWQRFDTMHYLRIARDGYAAVEDSVFPPLYPLLMRAVGTLFSPFMSQGARNLLAGIVLSNAALLAALVLLFRLAEEEIGREAAGRTLVYWLLFPSGLFLMAAYTESLFVLLVLAALYSARRDKFWLAGGLGYLATLTRLTGWVLVVPLAAVYLQRRSFKPSAIRRTILATLLPALGIFTFLAIRRALGLPAIQDVYQQYWLQTTVVPGQDLITAARQILQGAAPFILVFDFLSALFLLASTIIAFKRLGLVFGLYSALLLVFMLLPAAELKPLFSFSRYALAFFPTFMLMGLAGKNPWIHRLILYASAAFYLYFSGQFFMWGWVA